MSKYIWGVDSAQKVTDELINCVNTNYGKPFFWGRYLTTVKNVSDGLNFTEIKLIHQRNIKIMPIYNDFKTAVGYKNGQLVARNSIFNAGRLGIPKGTFIFVNIEDFFKVDEAWIRGLVDTFYSSNYRPGLYCYPKTGEFSSAFCEATKNSERVRIQTVLWSAEPTPGISKEKDAPKYNPASPPCETNSWAWQYGRDSKVCPIDTNLIDYRVYDNLW
ncbi:MAG: glycoside hydrolase domain-containing protein [Vulcanibacillus sp.]